MKPPEILSMLEEAAGTRMYESKKEAALKTLDKKQTKVDEIDQLLEQDIKPALEKLGEEKQTFMKHADLRARADNVRRFLVAWRFHKLEESVNGGGEAGALREQLSRAQAAMADARADAADREADIERLREEKERREGSEIQELKERETELTKAHVTKAAALKSKAAELKSEQKALAVLEGDLLKLDAATLEAALEEARGLRDEAVAAAEAAVKAVDAAERELAGAKAGDGRDESNRSMQERLNDARNAQTSAQSDVKKSDKAAAAAEKDLKAAEKEGGKLAADVAKTEQALAKAQAELAASGHDEEAARDLAQLREKEEAQAARWRDAVDALLPKARGALFEYDMPRPPPGFKRQDVLGTLAQLVRLKDPATAMALEVAGGKKLREVVVDSDATAKALLRHARLRSRTTFIPLNRIKASVIPEAKLQRARELAGDRATLALDLVEYDARIAPAVRYALGSVMVCKDDRTAKALAFSRDVGVRCVTLQGDDFNPSGVLSGGSRGSGPQILAVLSELGQARERLAGHEKAVEALAREVSQLEGAARAHAQLEQAVEVKAHALSLLREQVAVSKAHQVQVRVDRLRAELEAARAAKSGAEERLAAARAEAATLEDEIKNWGTIQKRKIADAEKKLASAKKAVEESRGRREAALARFAEAEEEAASGAGERAELAGRAEEARGAVAELEAAIEAAGAEEAAAKAALQEAQAALKEARDELKGCDADITRLGKERRRAESAAKVHEQEAMDLEQKLEHAQEQLGRDRSQLKSLAKTEPWIESERVHFGRPGSAYDFASEDFEKVSRRYEKDAEELRRSEKTINKKAMAMYEKVEAEYHALAEKKRIVENDRDKIERVITELDEKKREALHATWQKVDKDFGSIFSTLLPGTDAKLGVPEDQESFMEGLEVKVAFGGVWKQSLTELSGGQRSLLALSLILALLLFKPAPIYILDEVDAALDLSHTQNIGRMIKAHFPYSQFIVVSLKEGMFNNANVLFRTKFVDGVSTVMRTVPNRSAAAENEHQAAGAKHAGRARAAPTENTR